MDKKYHYDLIVIGSGPGGEKAAVKAAYFGYKVALLEKAKLYGGAGVVNGTLPSKTLKETSLFLSGKYEKGLYGVNRSLDQEASIKTFLYRKNLIITTGSEEIRENLARHNVTVIHGEASFVDDHQLHVQADKEVTISGKFILIATGSYPVHPINIPFNHENVHDSTSILNITYFPKSIAILGAGVIGLEYATIFSTMGVKVYLINRSDKLLGFIDQDIVKELVHSMKKDDIDLLFNQNLSKVEQENGKKLIVSLEEGEKLHVDMFLFAAGRNGYVKNLNLDKVGIEVDNRENIVVNDNYQTKIPHIYAVGDVIGFPALASTSMDQGRVAITHMFNTKDIEKLSTHLPYGIYTIPEVSTAGVTENEAKKENLSYEIGIAKHQNMPRGKIMGAKGGLLKLVFTKDDLVIRGVHIIGPLATELIHHGLDLIYSKRTLLDIIGFVYNFPTLHDLYKYAAYDGLGNLSGHKIK